MLLGGVGEALILKYVGAKLTGMIGAHLATSSATAVTHFAMHSAIAGTSAISAAGATGGAAGAATALYHSANANRKIYKAMAEEQDRMSEKVSDEEAAQAAIGFVLGMLAQGYYESLRHKNDSGDVKTELAEIACCNEGDCDCNDYMDDGSLVFCEGCGHRYTAHPRIDITKVEEGDATQIEWLWKAMAEELYPMLQNRDGNGKVKIDVDEVDTCVFESCPCADFNLCEEKQLFSRRCTCGHRWREHAVTGSWDWLVMGMVQMAIASMAEEET